ncbi:MAG: hypothetical protein IJI45_04685 [Anaerolineaceae bacterium]|nr:hypothetical protein [Parasporobacterium sp.]MBQ6480397.1 hypothetical protein [Anaerolineaceae bacterium]
MEELNLEMLIAVLIMAVIAASLRFVVGYYRARKELEEAEAILTETQVMAKIEASAPEQIAHAEAAYIEIQKAGAEKMEMCIDNLLDLVPGRMTEYFSRDLIRSIVQRAFDAVRAYADISIDKYSAALAAKVADRIK